MNPSLHSPTDVLLVLHVLVPTAPGLFSLSKRPSVTYPKAEALFQELRDASGLLQYEDVTRQAGQTRPSDVSLHVVEVRSKQFNGLLAFPGLVTHEATGHPHDALFEFHGFILDIPKLLQSGAATHFSHNGSIRVEDLFAWLAVSLSGSVRDALQGKAVTELRDRASTPDVWWRSLFQSLLEPLGVRTDSVRLVDLESTDQARQEARENEAKERLARDKAARDLREREEKERLIELERTHKEASIQADLSKAAAIGDVQRQKELEAEIHELAIARKQAEMELQDLERRARETAAEHELLQAEIQHTYKEIEVRKNGLDRQNRLEEARLAATIEELKHAAERRRVADENQHILKAQLQLQQELMNEQMKLLRNQFTPEKFAEAIQHILKLGPHQAPLNPNTRQDKVARNDSVLSDIAASALGITPLPPTAATVAFTRRMEAGTRDSRKARLHVGKAQSRSVGGLPMDGAVHPQFKNIKMPALRIGESLAFNVTSDINGHLLVLNAGTSDSFVMVTPNRYVPCPPPIIAGQSVPIPGDSHLPLASLLSQNIRFAELGPEGVEELIAFVTPRPLFEDWEILNFSTVGNMPWPVLSPKDVMELEQRFFAIPPSQRALGLLPLLVID